MGRTRASQDGERFVDNHRGYNGGDKMGGPGSGRRKGSGRKKGPKKFGVKRSARSRTITAMVKAKKIQRKREASRPRGFW